MATKALLPLCSGLRETRIACCCGFGFWRRVRFSFKASIAQSGIFSLSLFRFFVDHLSDDTRRLIHRGFRFGVIRFEQIAFCELRQFSVSFVV